MLLALMPKWTRPDLYFAVTVETDFAFTPEARRILRQYWLELALHTVVAFSLASLIGLEKTLAVPLAVCWLIIGLVWATARAHGATLKYSATPSSIREADLTPRRQHLPGGWPLALGPLAFLAAAAIYLTITWDQLPQRIAIHWGTHGADRWVDRTPLNVVVFLSLLASFCGVFLLLSYGILH
ncbi:MAG: DUF1648 domain-containing protein [bacterium]|nr:DUF1648 domain-containing protein [bacterium]